MRRGFFVWSRFVCLAFAVGCGGAKPQATQSKPPVPELEKDRLLVEKTQRPVVELRVTFEAGSADDPPGREGLSALTLATMLEGTAGGVSYAERERLLFPMAADIEGDVERAQMVLVGRVHRDHLAHFYPLFRDVFRAPAFEQTDFERNRARALSALTQELRGADDERLGKEVLQAMLFEHHPYGFPELGTERGLLAASVDDARGQWARLFCRERVRAAVSGAVDDEFIETLLRDLAALQRDACTAPRPADPPAVPASRRMWVVDKPEAQAVAISMGVPIDVTRAHPDYAALTLAAAYFGQHRTFAGRLMQRMRADRGLNYGDYAYAEHFVQDGFTRFPLPNVSRHRQYFSMWIRPLRPEQAHFALRMAVRELELLVSQGLRQADFERIQRFTDRYFALFAQTEQQRLGNLLDDAFYGVPGPHLDTLRAGIRGLTVEHVNKALKRHLDPSRLQIALVAPKAQELVDAVVANKPSPITYPAEKPADILNEDKVIQVHPVGVSREQVTVMPVARIFQ